MAVRPTKLLLQTTIPPTKDDWSIARFSLLGQLLKDAHGPDGSLLYQVTMRDRDPPGAPDSVLSTLDRSDYDQLWLFAVDVGDGLTREDCDAITRFQQAGGGLMVTRDHQDLGSSVCNLGGVGAAHHFHSHNPDPDPRRRQADDIETTNISWPNFHSGANGDFQTIAAVGPIHPLFAAPGSPTGAIRFLPSHPHEGDVSAPPNTDARVTATGVSKATGRVFNIAVAFEAGPQGGRAVAQSTFHHFCDYNWDTRIGAPSFVSEPPGDALRRSHEATAETRRYALNIAAWLGRRP